MKVKKIIERLEKANSFFRDKYEKSTEDVEVFNQYYTTLNQFLETSDSSEFKKATKNEFDTKIKIHKEEGLDISGVPANFFNFFAHEYVSYVLDPQKYSDDLYHLKLYKSISNSVKSRVKNEKPNYFDFAVISFAIMDNRLEELKETNTGKGQLQNGKFDFKAFHDVYGPFTRLIEEQVKKYFGNDRNLVYKPNFGSKKTGFISDGNWVKGKALIEIKCSKDPGLKLNYIRTAIGQFALNKKLEVPHDLDNKFIYWNPLYDIWQKFTISEIDQYVDAFDENRIDFINRIRKTKSKKGKEFMGLILEINRLLHLDPESKLSRKDATVFHEICESYWRYSYNKLK